MWKNFGKALLFLTVFAVLFLGISPVFVPKDNSGGAGIHVPNAKGFLGEPADTLDVLFLGDSEAYSSFIPLEIWEEYGITSYVCSNGDQMIYECASYLQWFLKNQSPKVVVLETNTLYRSYTLAQLLRHGCEERLPYLRYHDRWKWLRMEDLGSPVEFTRIVPNKGYLYFTESTVTGMEGYMAYSDEVDPVPYLSTIFVKQMENVCREQGIQLILVSAPSPTNWNYYYHNGVQALAQELKLPYIDMNLMPVEIPIDWNCESYDGGDHLNYGGACKVTAYMGKYLWDTGLFTDKRELASYSDWNAAAAAFRENPQR